ncbi:MAG: arsenate reductase ArsC [Myxococcota bacterium]|nr:arsenate reductase ArsC [Myxococcota bacterium]
MSKGILFLCFVKSARSQMAEGIAKKLLPQRQIQSAGSKATHVNPFAAKALEELGISTEEHFSKSVESISPDTIGIVITLCAEEVCPVFLGHAEHHHWPFSDPADVEGTDEEKLISFRNIRDQIHARLTEFFGSEIH